MFWRKQREVESKVFEYLDKVSECLECFQKAFRHALREGLGESLDGLVEATHALESKCDGLRREVEKLLFGKALLPESRADILNIMETLDLLPNQAEEILFEIQLQKMVFPDDLKEDFDKLVSLNLGVYALLKAAIRTLFERPPAARAMTDAVETEESRSDRMERALIKRIFDSSLPGDQKILFRDLVNGIGNLSTGAETVADRVAIVSITRHV